MIGVGLFYRRGYFRQRLNLAGRQQEYWLANDPKSLPMARVSGADGKPLRLSIQVAGRGIAFDVWRVDVGRVPLLLLDTELPANDAVSRWTTARLYEGNRAVRLSQYGLLGIGGARVLDALGIEPAVIHLNEGHPALAPLELATLHVERGAAVDDALEEVRARTVFTTHTPVPAGNETYEREEFLDAFGDLAYRLGVDDDEFLGLCRVEPGNGEELPGMTPLAIRMSHRRNGVSRLHGSVARAMWQPMFPGKDPEQVPITHVTNGAHVATFVGGADARAASAPSRKRVARAARRSRSLGGASAPSRTPSSGRRAARRAPSSCASCGSAASSIGCSAASRSTT